MSTIDFTNCKVVPFKAYAGANGQKICIEYNDDKYMLKFPPVVKSTTTALSYSNSCICEHIASSIFNILGINAQQTILGTYNIKNKTKIVCACKDFTANGEMFYDFSSIKNTIIDSEHQGFGTELNDLLETIEKQQFIDSKELLEYFWDVFVVDAFLGNFDRHNGNWGFLVNQNNEASIAPVFDCGSCLLPQADDKIMKNVLENENELNARIFTFPTSAIKKNDTKINYYDFLTTYQNADLSNAIERIYNRIDLEKIFDFIDTVPLLTELQIEFYKTYISERYNKIIKTAYELLH